MQQWHNTQTGTQRTDRPTASGRKYTECSERMYIAKELRYNIAKTDLWARN